MRLIDADALIEFWEADFTEEERSKLHIPLNVAIENLRDAPTVDAVERKRGEWTGAYNHGKSKGFKKGRTYEINKKWIPCSERLPKEEKYYLVTTYDDDGYLDVDICYWEDDDANENNGFCIATDVLAWMAFPMPWNKKGEEK